MFDETPNFNGPFLSPWDTSKITRFSYMFYRSSFNGDISSWTVNDGSWCHGMFSQSQFNRDLCPWDLENKPNIISTNMFDDSPLSAYPYGCKTECQTPVTSCTGEQILHNFDCPDCATCCIDCTICASGQYLTTPCTDYEPGICSPCPAGQYCPGDNLAYNCSTSCGAKEFISSACSSTTDIVCTNCSTTCGSDEYISADCTATSDTQCSACTVCASGQQFAAIGCNATSDTVCEDCLTCGDGTFGVCTPYEDTICNNCSTCESGKYVFEGDKCCICYFFFT